MFLCHFFQKIRQLSPNMQKGQAACPSGAKVKRSKSSVPNMQQGIRSPSSPIPVPQICVSPQEENAVKMRHQSPESQKHHLGNYNSWNADMGCKFKQPASSPCQRGERDNCRDENGNSLRRKILKLTSSHECLRNAQHPIDLSASAPEHSLRPLMGSRQHRLYSMPYGNHLSVPQSNLMAPMSPLEEKENNKKNRLFSSQNNLSSTSLEDDLSYLNIHRQNLPHPKSQCGPDSMWAVSDASPKSKHGVLQSVKAVIKNFGLSPRVSPCHSPGSSRSPSPSSSPTPSPYGSPFSPTVEWPFRHF